MIIVIVIVIIICSYYSYNHSITNQRNSIPWNGYIHETKSQSVELLHLAEERVQVSTYGEVGDGEVTYNSQTETHTGNGRKGWITGVVIENVSSSLSSKLEISRHYE